MEVRDIEKIDKSTLYTDENGLKKGDYLLWLSTIIGITRKDMSKMLLSIYTAMDLFYLDEKTLREEIFSKYRLKVKLKDFLESRDPIYIERYKENLASRNIKYVSIYDDNYPYSLHSLNDKAYLLYYQGTLKNHDLSIGVVGARRCTEYARTVGYKFSKDLASKGVNIVSGLAYGIDSSAHLATLEAGGFTTAVVGCGFDYCYPAGNKSLMDKIIKNGIVFSEYAPSVRPAKYTFPLRNRIISGLSEGVLLVEARKKSGSLITINHALDIGKDVFAVPLDILGGSNEGGNQVIRDGGKIVFNYEDILEEYPLFLEKLKLKEVEVKDEKESDIELLFDENEKIVYDSISYREIELEEIAEKNKIGISDLQFALIKLEMKGLIKALSNRRYIRV